MPMMTSRPIRIAFPLLVWLAATAAGCGPSPAPPAQSTSAPAAPEGPKLPAVGLYVTNETSGDLTDQLKSKFNDFVDSIRDSYQGMKDQAEDLADQGASKMNTFKNEANNF